MLIKIFFFIPVGFFELIHKEKDAASQNSTLLSFLCPYVPVKRCPRKDEPRQRNVSVQYTVRDLQGTIRIVCAKSFLSITAMSMYIEFFSFIDFK